MNGQIRLSEYATTPLYNIKAVVQTTGISPSTLRAWERRYNMCQPQRSGSGYRLYSDRDIAVIRWLKTQVDAGMAISQAVAWLETLGVDAQHADEAVLPNSTVKAEMRASLTPSRLEPRSLTTLQTELVDALTNFDEATAEQLMAEAFALYSIEQVGEELIAPVLGTIGDRWHRGELSITREHFATNYLLQRLTAILRAVPNLGTGASIWVGCAPGEMHEVGAVLLTIYLRRAGLPVHYLGQNLAASDLIEDMKHLQPAMVLLSASTLDAVQGLADMSVHFDNFDTPKPIIGYGGRAFVGQPELRRLVAGVFLGDSGHEAVDRVRKLLHNGHHTIPAEEKAALHP